MVSPIIDGLPYTDRYGNDIYTDFRNMLKMEYIFNDKELEDEEKTILALRLFYGENLPQNLTMEQMMNECIYFYIRDKCDKKDESSKICNKKIYDFEQDADYIYAAFLSAYDVDLYDEHTQLHWWKFMALFAALPEDTQMSKRMYYRSIDTSKMKGSQKKEYERLKKAVALKKKQNIALKTMTAEDLEKRTRERIVQRFVQAKKEFEKTV